jgi:hypothetical protein
MSEGMLSSFSLGREKLFDADTAKSSWTEVQPNVRFGSKADMCSALAYVCFGPEADMCAKRHVRFVA